MTRHGWATLWGLALAACTGKTGEVPPAQQAAASRGAAADGPGEAPPGSPGPHDREASPSPAGASPSPAGASPSPAGASPSPAGASPALLPEPQPVAARSPGIVVIDSGKAPSRVLALAPAVGAKATIPVTLQMRLAVALGDHETPPTQIPAIGMQLTTAVRIADDTRVVVEIAATDVEATGEVASARVRKAVAEAVEHLGQARAALTVTRADGLTEMQMQTKSDPGGAVTPMQPSLDGLFDTLTPMFIALPSVPVGVGARWEVVSHHVEGGATTQQVVTYTLTELGPHTVSATWEATRATVTVDDTGGAVVLAHGAKGQGRARMDLQTGAPAQATATLNTRTHARVKFGESLSNVTVHLLTRLQAGNGP